MTPQAPASARDDTRRALRWLGLAVVVVVSLFATVPLCVNLGRRAPGTHPWLILLVISQLWCALELVLGRTTRLRLWGLLVATLFAQTMLLATRGAVRPPDWAPGYWAITLVALAMSRLPRREYVAYTLTLMGGIAVEMLCFGWGSWWLAGTELSWALLPPIQALLFGDALLLVAANNDESRLAEAEARAARRRVDDENNSRREGTRLLHDHVLHALHGMARAVDDASARHVADDCRTALAAIERRAQEHDARSIEQQGLLDADAQHRALVSDHWHITPNPQTRKAVVNTAIPGLVLAVLIALLAGPHMPHSETLIPLAAAMVALGGFSLLSIHRRPPGRVLTATLALVAMAGWLVNLTLAPRDAQSFYVLWITLVAAPLVHILALAAPLAVALGLSVGWTLVQIAGLVLHFGTIDSALAMVPIVSTSAGTCLIITAILALVRRQSALQLLIARQSDELAADTTRVRHAYLQDHSWSERVTRDALPLLQDVAQGRSNPADPQVRAAAARMEVELRDELLLGPQHEGLIARLAQVRGDGWKLDSTLTDHDSVTSLELAERLLALIGKPAMDGQPLTLSVTPRAAAAVILGTSTPEQHRRWEDDVAALGGTAVVDEDFVRLMLPAAVLDESLEAL